MSVATVGVNVRSELEVVLRNRAKGYQSQVLAILVDRALGLYDTLVKQDIPEVRAAMDAALWFGREEVAQTGY